LLVLGYGHAQVPSNPHAFWHLVECGRAQFLHKHERTNALIRRAGFPDGIFEVFLRCFGRGNRTMRRPIKIIEKKKKVKIEKKK